MSAVILVIHMILALAIIGLVLLQRSEGGGLGIGGGTAGGLTTAQGAASALTRATWWCVAGFFVTSLALGVMSGRSGSANSILDKLDVPAAATQAATTPEAPVDGLTITTTPPQETPAPATTEAPAPAEAPSAPVAE